MGSTSGTSMVRIRAVTFLASMDSDCSVLFISLWQASFFQSCTFQSTRAIVTFGTLHRRPQESKSEAFYDSSGIVSNRVHVLWCIVAIKVSACNVLIALELAPNRSLH